VAGLAIGFSQPFSSLYTGILCRLLVSLGSRITREKQIAICKTSQRDQNKKDLFSCTHTGILILDAGLPPQKDIEVCTWTKIAEFDNLPSGNHE
jgi:hypothetical protein